MGEFKVIMKISRDWGGTFSSDFTYPPDEVWVVPADKVEEKIVELGLKNIPHFGDRTVDW